MRIKTLLSLTSALSLVMILVMIVSLGWSFLSVGKANANLALAGTIKTTHFEMIFLRDEYFIRRENRAKVQWLAKAETLSAQLEQAKAAFHDAGDVEILEEMVKEKAQSISIYKKFAENARKPAEGEPGQSLAGEYEKALFSQLLIRSYILNNDASRLEEKRLGDLTAIKNTSDLILSGSLTLVVLLVLANSFFIGRILSRGIALLQAGVSNLGSGNLEYRLAVDRDDEVTDVARGINRMAAELMGSFTSIDNLEKEAEKRKLAEEEVNRLNTDLEARIAQRTSQLETSNRELEAFAYSVAHDLRAPLRSIDGFAHILQAEYGKVLDEEGLRMFGIIRSSAQTLDKLINDLLEVTRIGKTELSFTVVDMRALAMEAFRSCADPAALAAFEFKVGSLPAAFADPALMERVWANLLSNAVKYSLPSPVHRIEIDGSVRDGMNVYCVVDHGVGFDQRYVDKLFGMFQRLHSTEEFQGSGIGLAIIRRIVVRHGGQTWAEGRPGEGAAFYFSIPERS
jgi:signal transduction histidine kinase